MSPHSFLNFSCFSKRVPTFLLTHPLSSVPIFSLIFLLSHNCMCVLLYALVSYSISCPSQLLLFLIYVSAKALQPFQSCLKQVQGSSLPPPRKGTPAAPCYQILTFCPVGTSKKKTPHLSMILFEWCPNISDLYHTILALEKKIHQKTGR